MKNLKTKLAILVAIIAISFTSCEKEVYTDGWTTNIKEYPQSLTTYLSKGNDNKLDFKVSVILRSENIKDNKLKEFKIYTFVDDDLSKEKILFKEFTDVGLDKNKYTNLILEKYEHLKNHVIYELKYSIPLKDLGLDGPKEKPISIFVAGHNGVEFNEVVYTDK